MSAGLGTDDALPPLARGGAFLGRTLNGRFRLDALMAEGLDTVFRAQDLRTGNPVVVKVLTTATTLTPEVRRELNREARLLARLHDPHVCQVLDYGFTTESDLPEQPFLAMELCTGRSLAEVLAESGPLTPFAAGEILTQVAAALHEAHQEGIVHRDLKPANVFVVPAGEGSFTARLLDFEVGLAAERRRLRLDQHRARPEWLVPDLVRDTPDAVSPRTDVYGLGLLFYALLAGHPPFHGPVASKVMLGHLREPPPALPGPEELPLRRALDAHLREALAKDPEQRPRSASAFAEGVHRTIGLAGNAAFRILDPPAGAEVPPAPDEAPPPAPAPRGHTALLLGLAALAAAGAAAWYFYFRHR